MGLDDSGTLARLKTHRRELIDPKIAEYGGRIVKTTGDGLLLEFPSVVDAVRCAVDMQRGMAERDAGVPPEQRIEFRIGINVGDVIIDGDDIFGDGVNVAARLQTLAEPGGICASRTVRDQVLDKLSFTFEDIGPQQVKNIARPVEVYRIRDYAPAVAAVQPQRLAGPRRLVAGITPGAHWGWLTGATAVVVIAGIAIWYLFVQPKIPSTAVGGPPLLSVAVMPFTPASASADDERFAERMTQDVTSAVERATRYATVVSHGLVAKYKGGANDARAVGHDMSLRAIQADRDDSRVWIVRAEALMWQANYDGAFEATSEALRIDPHRNSVLMRRAQVLMLMGRSGEALPILDQAIALDPHSPGVPFFVRFKCRAHLDLGQYDEAISACEKGLALDPDWMNYLWLVAAYTQKGEAVKAMAAKAELMKEEPNFSIARYRTFSTITPPSETNVLGALRKAGIPEK
jgi:hypothetical protein